MKGKLKTVGDILLRFIIGVPIVAVGVVAITLLLTLLKLAVVHYMVTLTVIACIFLAMFCYVAGNVTVKKYKKRKEYKKFKREFYD